MSRGLQLCLKWRALTFVRTCLRVWDQRAQIGSVVLLGALLGCGSSSENTPTEVTQPPVPPLESVSFQLLGSGKVAFERIGGSGAYVSIYTIDATAMRSTHAFDDGLTWGPALSPDGRRIAFLRYTDNATWYDVYVANIDGSAVQHVTRFPLQEGPPTWTPDGRGLVMTVSAADGILQDVYMQSPVLDSPDRTQLTNFTVGAEGSLVCPIILDSKTPVAISRHGMMAFACQFGEIDVLAPDGTLAASYVPSHGDRRRWPNVFAPSWSPDGTRLAFIETISDSATNYALVGVAVKVMDVDGGNVVTIATSPSTAAGGGWVGPNNLSLCWMADGSRVVFNVPESELVGHLWVAKADGSGLAQLTSAPGAWDRSVSCSR